MRRWGGRDKDAKGSVHLLEVGCGVGAMAFWLANNGFLVDATDASYQAIHRAEHLYGCVYPHSLRFHRQPVPGLTRELFGSPMQPVTSAILLNSYDGVVDVCCLQHVDDLDAALGEIKEVLISGGQLLSIMACADHSPVMREELKGATFHRLTQVEVHRHFTRFSSVRLESMTHTDNGGNISHWIIEATK